MTREVTDDNASLNKNCILFKNETVREKEYLEIKNTTVDIKFSDKNWRIRLRRFLWIRKKDKELDNGRFLKKNN